MVDLLSSGSLSGSGISFTGLASGLDTASIVSALVKLESLPIQAMQSKIDKANSLNALYTKLKTKLETLEDKATALATPGKGFAFTAASSDDKVLTGSVTGSALAGAHEINVTQLAKAGRELGGGIGGAIYADSSITTVGNGNLSITFAGTTTSVDVSGMTLNQAASAINDANLGVTASVINTGASGSPSYKLVITGNKTGSANDVSVSAGAGVNLEFTTLTTAQNAILDVDGVTIERDANTVSDIVEGVTLDLKNLGAATLTVSPDVSSVKSKIQSLVDAYNDVVSFVSANSTYNSESKIAGAFFGEATAKSIQNSLTKTVIKSGTSAGSGSTSLSDEEGFSSLSIVGIKLQADGSLKVDDTKLTDKLEENLAQVVDLFADTDGTGGDVGIASLLKGVADAATTGGTASDGVGFDGLIESKQASIQKQIANLQKQIDDAQEHVNNFEAQLNAKFSAFESVMAQLNTQKAALSSVFGF